MSGVPTEIPGLGDTAQAPRQNPEFDPLGHGGLSNEDYFVFSRIDGSSSLRDLILMTGFGTDKTVGILHRLREFGAILVGDETPEHGIERSARAPTVQAPVVTGQTGGPPPAEPPSGSSVVKRVATVADTDLTDAERVALNEDNALSDSERRRILTMLRVVAGGNYFDLLGVDPGANKRQLKRAYFVISKEFHPDRHFGKDLGTFTDWLATIFEAANDAYATLSSAKTRADYEARLRGEPSGPAASRTQTREEHAAQLFDQACQEEIRGNSDSALRLFAAVARMLPTPRYMRRAARCATTAGELQIALEYAKKAAELEPDNPSYARVLADVYRSSDQLEKAEKTLLAALEMKSENDVLLGELQEDLAEVRKLLEAPA